MKRKHALPLVRSLLTACVVFVAVAALLAGPVVAEGAGVSIAGTVHSADAENYIQITLYREVDGSWQWADSCMPAVAGPDFEYAFSDLSAGNYKVEFHNGGLGWLPEFYNDKRTMDEADVIVYDGATPQTGIDCTFDAAPVSIAGTAHSANAQNSLSVTLYREVGDPGSGTWEWADARSTWMAGPAYDYAFYGLAAGNYKVEFSEGGPWLPEFYNDKRTMAEADVVVYDGATPRTGIDCTFDSQPVSIGGTLHSADEWNAVSITLYREVDGAWQSVDGLWTMSVGPVYDYAFYGLAAGRYKVEFHNDGTGWLPEFYNDKRTIDEADVIVYDGATPRIGIDGTFDPAPVSIGGTVHSADPTDGLQVTLYRQFDWGWTVVDTRYTMVAGPEYGYGFYGLDPGNYKVGFDIWPYGWLPEFYNDKRTLDEGDAVVYDGTTSRTGIDCTFDPIPPMQQADDLLAFYRDGISNWMLQGVGTDKTAPNRAAALELQILRANELVHNGKTTQAIDQLESIHDKCDGEPRPPDFVDGMSRTELARRVEMLIRALGGGL